MCTKEYFAVTIYVVLCLLSIYDLIWIVMHVPACNFSCDHLMEQIKVISSYGAKPRQDLPKLVRLRNWYPQYL